MLTPSFNGSSCRSPGKGEGLLGACNRNVLDAVGSRTAPYSLHLGDDLWEGDAEIWHVLLGTA
jgi:hypothetical protein